MALRQQQQLKQQQKLSPLQIQVVKLIELPVLELEEKIKQELEDNPALEEGYELEENPDTPVDDSDDDGNISQEDLALGDYFSEEETPDYLFSKNTGITDTSRTDIPFSGTLSMHEFLINQIAEAPLNEIQAKIAEYIIGNISESGYLDRSLTAISDDLMFQQNIDVPVSELEYILQTVQHFEPAGIAARTLQECLLLQLERKPASLPVDRAIVVIRDYFDEFSKKHYPKIMKALLIDENELKEVIHEITTLDPKPGNSWGDSISQTLNTIVPDFLVESNNGELILALNNRNIPPLRVSREYGDLLKGYASNKESMNVDSKNAAQFVRQKLDSARWFIDAIRQRQETMQRTMHAILERQYDFFLTGEESDLRPMILKDIAEITGYDISTVSRVSNSKYVQCSFGIFPLKYFFSESMQTDSGEEISSREIKAILKECISNENKNKPLPDEKLAEILKERGYIIARRTVAKYREQMNIPVARLRKEI